MKKDRLKRCLGVLTAIVIGFDAGYIYAHVTEEKTVTEIFAGLKDDSWQDKEYHSKVGREDCAICNTMAVHKGEDNLGIISLEDGSVTYLEINRYDESGEQVEKKQTYNTFHFGDSREEDKLKVYEYIDVSREYGKADIEFASDKYLNMSRVKEICCDECIKKIQAEYYPVLPYNVGVIDYSTGDIRLLAANTLSFFAGDFFVACEPWAHRGESELSEMKLLMFYCPEQDDRLCQ